MTTSYGPADRIEVMQTAGAAYRKNFQPRQIKSAFERRGFITNKRRRSVAQKNVLTALQAQVEAKTWAEKQLTAGRLPREILKMPSLQPLRKSGKKRQPLGPNLPAVGLLNGDESLNGLVDLMAERKDKRAKRRCRVEDNVSNDIK